MRRLINATAVALSLLLAAAAHELVMRRAWSRYTRDMELEMRRRTSVAPRATAAGRSGVPSSVHASASALRKLQQAHQKMQSGELSAAALLCEEVLARAPRNPDALWLLGTIRVMTGEPQAAVPLLERATGAVPSHGAALEMLGLAHLMLSDFVAAERVLREALDHCLEGRELRTRTVARSMSRRGNA